MKTTRYSEVYSWFLDKVTAYSLTMFDDTVKAEIVYGYMRSACAKFKCCKIDLSSRDDELGVFNNTLDDEMLDIISETMVVAWLQPKLNNEEILKDTLGTKDYSNHSPANLLAKITDAFKLAKKNSSNMISNYSFNHGTLPKRGGK